jgi:hypothetical protein
MTIDRELIRRRANYLCEYCHSPERISATRFTIDHIIPQSLGGDDNLNNLALACRRCNERRYNFVAGYDPVTQTIVPLFNPRQQQWGEHFSWSADGQTIIGITPTGRATLSRFDLNDERYSHSDSIRNTRSLWVLAGWHPPSGDPRLDS